MLWSKKREEHWPPQPKKWEFAKQLPGLSCPLGSQNEESSKKNQKGLKDKEGSRKKELKRKEERDLRDKGKMRSHKLKFKI